MKFTEKEEHDLTNFILSQTNIQDDATRKEKATIALYTRAIVRTLIREIERIRPEGGVESFIKKLPPGYSIELQAPSSGPCTARIFKMKPGQVLQLGFNDPEKADITYIGCGPDLLTCMEQATIKLLTGEPDAQRDTSSN